MGGTLKGAPTLCVHPPDEWTRTHEDACVLFASSCVLALVEHFIAPGATLTPTPVARLATQTQEHTPIFNGSKPKTRPHRPNVKSPCLKHRQFLVSQTA